VRTRLAVCSSAEYTGIAVQAAKMWRAGGIPCFYRGLVPSTVSGWVEVGYRGLVAKGEGERRAVERKGRGGRWRGLRKEGGWWVVRKEGAPRQPWLGWEEAESDAAGKGGGANLAAMYRKGLVQELL
jgi:hypothetical protein